MHITSKVLQKASWRSVLATTGPAEVWFPANGEIATKPTAVDEDKVENLCPLFFSH